ncbi:MAG TPA: DUF5988 family protein [Pseudonocardiaceae bacterium]|nr:DUF5988 family protein [Pseudonocardiaceae bacterium]
MILRGGSAEHLPDALCTRHVEDSGVPLKIQWGNRYEHFSPTVEKVIHDGNELLVFAWTTTTYVAE